MSSPRSQEERDMVERIILYAMNDRAVLKDVGRAVNNAYQEYMKELISEAKNDFKAFEKYIVAEINKRRAPVPERSVRDYMPHDGFPLGDPRYREDGRYASSVSSIADRHTNTVTVKKPRVASKNALVITNQRYNNRVFELTQLGKSLPDFLKAPLMKEIENTAWWYINTYRGQIEGNFKYDKGVIFYPDNFNDQLEAKNLWKLNDKAFDILTSESWLHFDD